jgi:hypothetical protein
MHYERAPHFRTSKLDVTASATGREFATAEVQRPFMEHYYVNSRTFVTESGFRFRRGVVIRLGRRTPVKRLWPVTSILLRVSLVHARQRDVTNQQNRDRGHEHEGLYPGAQRAKPKHHSRKPRQILDRGHNCSLHRTDRHATNILSTLRNQWSWRSKCGPTIRAENACRFSGSAALAATCFNPVLGSVFHQADIIRAAQELQSIIPPATELWCRPAGRREILDKLGCSLPSCGSG